MSVIAAFRMRPGDPTAEPGYWAYFQRDGRGTMTALISCPICGTTGTLERQRIAFDGWVELMVRCGSETCSWVARLGLIDWDPFRRE